MMTRPSHIFIVGLPRSGTSILRNILNSSVHVAICGETHFLGSPNTSSILLKYLFNRPEEIIDLSAPNLLKKPSSPGSREAFAKVGDISTDSGVKKVVDYIYNSSPTFWGWLADHIDHETFAQSLLKAERSDRSLFDSLMAFYAGGKSIRGEKTPDHIHNVPTLLKWFPDAKIIHMFRDLRAVFVSQRRKKALKQEVSLCHRLFRQSELVYEVYMSVNVTVHWLRVVQLHWQYQQLYPNSYYCCRFEDLVGDPQTHLKRICEFLKIDFTEKMLQQSFQNSSLIPRHHARGLDAAAALRWKKHLHPIANKLLLWWGRKYLLEFGYQL